MVMKQMFSWEQRKVGDISSVVGGGTPNTNNPKYWDGNIDWYAPAEMEGKIYASNSERKITKDGLKNSSAKLLPANRTILFTSRAGIGKSAILTKISATNQGFQSLVLNDNIDAYFVYSLTPILKEKAESIASGSTFLEISGKMLSNIRIIIPDGKEQQRVGLFFESIDNLITLHQRKCEKLQDLKKGLLEKMFPADGSDKPQIRFKGFTEAWEQREIKDIAERFDNLRIPVAASQRESGTIPYYGANGIQDYVNGFTHNGEFVLVAEDGANDLKNYPVQYVNGKIWVNNHAHVLQSNKNNSTMFLKYLIGSADIESLLVGGGRAKLNAEVLMSIDLILPNKDEQKQIAIFFDRLDSLITLHQRKCEKLKNLKKALLQKMFA